MPFAAGKVKKTNVFLSEMREFKAGFDEPQDGFNELGGLGLGEVAWVADTIGDVGFGQGHVVSYLLFEPPMAKKRRVLGQVHLAVTGREVFHFFR